MNLVNKHTPDLDNEVTITLTERELLIISAAVDRISPVDARDGVYEDYGITISTTDCMNVCRSHDIADILFYLGYKRRNGEED